MERDLRIAPLVLLLFWAAACTYMPGAVKDVNWDRDGNIVMYRCDKKYMSVAYFAALWESNCRNDIRTVSNIAQRYPSPSNSPQQPIDQARAPIQQLSKIAPPYPPPANSPQQPLDQARTPIQQLSEVDTAPTTKNTKRAGAYALVVGIESYRQGLPKADFAVRDARVVAEYLTKSLGYEEENVVILLNDRATKTDLEKYVEGWMPSHVEKNDSVFVYFSGHGAPNTKSSEAYLVPYDGDPAFVDQTGYPLKRLYEQLAKLPAKEVVVILDSCFSGAGGRSVIAKGSRPMVNVMPMSAVPENAAVLSASSSEQTSSTYEQKGHGLLTYFFLKGLHGDADINKDGTVNLAELFAFVKPQVERMARREFNNEQTPQLSGNSNLLAKGFRLTNSSR